MPGNDLTAGTALSTKSNLSEGRYGTIAATLHWMIAGLIILQIGLGWYMTDFVPSQSAIQDRLVTIHISVGLTILLLVIVRIAVRLTHTPPLLTATHRAWERYLARAVHILFYVLMLALPLTGWALASAWPNPIKFWGIPWPHLPDLAFLMTPVHHPLRDDLDQIHTSVLAWTFLATLLLHVAGALKHQFDGHPVLWRMIPALKPKMRGN